jgi:hypothetical protein
MIKVTYKKLDGTSDSSEIPTSWRDLTWKEFVDFNGKKFDNQIERIAYLTKINYTTLLNNPMFLQSVIESCSFIYKRSIEEWVDYIPEKFHVDIASAEWGKLEISKDAILRAKENQYEAGAKIVKTYLDIEIDHLPCTEAIGVVAFFLSKYQSL